MENRNKSIVYIHLRDVLTNGPRGSRFKLFLILTEDII
jgi:hypothetical protein